MMPPCAICAMPTREEFTHYERSERDVVRYDECYYVMRADYYHITALIRRSDAADAITMILFIIAIDYYWYYADDWLSDMPFRYFRSHYFVTLLLLSLHYAPLYYAAMPYLIHYCHYCRPYADVMILLSLYVRHLRFILLLSRLRWFICFSWYYITLSPYYCCVILICDDILLLLAIKPAFRWCHYAIAIMMPFTPLLSPYVSLLYSFAVTIFMLCPFFDDIDDDFTLCDVSLIAMMSLRRLLISRWCLMMMLSLLRHAADIRQIRHFAVLMALRRHCFIDDAIAIFSLRLIAYAIAVTPLLRCRYYADAEIDSAMARWFATMSSAIRWCWWRDAVTPLSLISPLLIYPRLLRHWYYADKRRPLYCFKMARYAFCWCCYYAATMMRWCWVAIMMPWWLFDFHYYAKITLLMLSAMIVIVDAAWWWRLCFSLSLRHAIIIYAYALLMLLRHFDFWYISDRWWWFAAMMAILMPSGYARERHSLYYADAFAADAIMFYWWLYCRWLSLSLRYYCAVL